MEQFQEKLLEWYKDNKRDLIFRKDENPYHIWVSEIMAQQTRIEAMLGYYQRFMKALPDMESLANVDIDELRKLWQGLGYYSRANNLQKCAKVCMGKYNGKLPSTKKELETLPGIGPYTAGAIASIAYHENVSAVDGNVIRVFSRLYDVEKEVDSKIKKEITQLVDASLPGEKKISDYNQALMEIGALICIPKNPRCEQCPISEECLAYQKNVQDKLPLLPKKKERKKVKKTIYIYVFENKIHLQKREEKGLLAGLYGFDEKEQKVEIIEKIELKPYTHIFSHVEWEMNAYMIRVKEGNNAFYTIKEIDKQYAIPSAFQPFYKQVKEIL